MDDTTKLALGGAAAIGGLIGFIVAVKHASAAQTQMGGGGTGGGTPGGTGGGTGGGSTPPPAPLMIYPSISTTFQEPDGTTYVDLGVSVTGGTFPYTFTIVWGDGELQENTTGVFSRSFPPGAVPVSSGTITVVDASLHSVSVTVLVT